MFQFGGGGVALVDDFPLMVHLSLRPCNDIVDPLPDVLHLVLPVQVASDLIVRLDELLELLLEAVVLVVQVGHVAVEGVDLGLEVDLVFEHLVGMLLEPVDFVGHLFFVLNQLVQRDLILLQFQVVVLAVHVLVLVGLEHL